MRGTLLLLAVMAMFTISHMAQAATVQGKTADGCSYKIINGQYLTSCPGRPSAAEPTLVAQAQAQPNQGRPVGGYGDVPVRKSDAAPVSNYAQPSPQSPAPPRAVVSSIEREEGFTPDYQEDDRRERLRGTLLDKTYAGIILGSSNMKESNAGSSMGLGLNIGTNIDDHFGVELGYSYAKQDLRLGLASRGANTDLGLPAASMNDSTLNSHLLTGEFQAHLTDPLKRLRPYLGAGLGWRSATLSENRQNIPNQMGYSTTTGGGSLRQTAIGGLASAGTKLRINKAFHVGVAFRYFFPLLRQDARLEQPATIAAGNSEEQIPNGTKLTQADDTLTGSTQYQVIGGVHYSF